MMSVQSRWMTERVVADQVRQTLRSVAETRNEEARVL